MKLLILTGLRESEVTEAKGTEFDLTAGLWKIRTERTKSARTHLVHLAPQAVAIIEALRPLTEKKRHVFESPLKPGQAIYGRPVRPAVTDMTLCHRLASCAG